MKLRISASAIKKYGYPGSCQGCPRRWAFDKLAGFREPDSIHTEAGRECHAITERWLSLGVLRGDPKWLPVVQEAIHDLPRPGTVAVEVPFEFQYEGIWFHGFIDVVDFEHQSKIDHKFVGGFNFAMSPEELAHDPQAVIYALAPPYWPETLMVWNYTSKRGKGCRPTELQLSREDAEAFMRTSILPMAREMIAYTEAFAGITGEAAVDQINATIPCEPGDCWSFNQHCPHGSRCTHLGYR